MHRRTIRAGGLTVAAFLVLLFTSCFGVEMKTVFNADGSGRMTTKFRVSQMLLEMGEEESGVDIPLSKEELTRQYEGLEGVTVVEVTEEDTEEDRIITAVIDFDDFNALASREDLPGEDASLQKVDGRSIFQILIGPPAQDPPVTQPDDTGAGEDFAQLAPPSGMDGMDESMIAMMQSFMEGYQMEYTIVAPGKILSHSHGEIAKDGRTLTYGVPMGDFIMIEEPYYLEVTW